MATPSEQMDLEEQFFPTTAALAQRWLPWLRILRGFRMAISARRMLLALLAIWLWQGGLWLLDRQYPETLPSQSARAPANAIATAGRPQRCWLDLPEERQLTPRILESGGTNLWWPMTRVIEPVVTWAFASPPQSTVYLVLKLALGVAISVLLGGAISRMAAVDFALGENVSLRAALQSAFRRSWSCLGAPLIAGIGLAACWCFIASLGLLSRLPLIGETLVAVIWILPLLAGLLMVLILLGIGLGWPLMIAGIQTEGSDAFDGLSRACSYLLHRPWYALFLVACVTVYGLLLVLFVETMVQSTQFLTHAAFQAGQLEPELPIDRHAPQRIVPLEQLTGGISVRANLHAPAQSVFRFWNAVMESISTAFTFSYFWTMMTIIYFLLRKREDATPLNEVWMPREDAVKQMPLVGIPAAELRESQLRGNPLPPAEGPASVT